MELIRDVDKDKVKQAIVQGIVLTCKYIGSLVVAEGMKREQSAIFWQMPG
jgi:EAL domain-containing protein (putative c-di-GMP-specific phosphodiesterase class I)